MKLNLIDIITNVILESNIDEGYFNLIEMGDDDGLRRMVDDYAKSKGYIMRVYHGTTRSNWTAFRYKSQPYKPKKWTEEYGEYHSNNGMVRIFYSERVGGWRINSTSSRLFDNYKEMKKKVYDSMEDAKSAVNFYSAYVIHNYRDAFFFSTDLGYARKHSHKSMFVPEPDDTDDERILDCYIKYDKLLDYRNPSDVVWFEQWLNDNINDDVMYGIDTDEYIASLLGKFKEGYWGIFEGFEDVETLISDIKTAGYDGYVTHEGIEFEGQAVAEPMSICYAIFDEKNIKLADIMTYEGSEIIPLSNRFTDKHDIRY